MWSALRKKKKKTHHVPFSTAQIKATAGFTRSRFVDNKTYTV